jgi:hypothetical protein
VGEIATGLLFVDPAAKDLHASLGLLERAKNLTTPSS